MKKIWGALIFFVLSFHQVWGQELSDKQRWIEQVDGGLVIPASAQAAQNYAIGFGGDVLMGYRFTKHWSLSADLGYYNSDQNYLPGANGAWAYTPLMAVARYSLGSGWLKPYFSLGIGMAFNSYTQVMGSDRTSQTETDFLSSPGLGVLWVIESDMALYLQGRADINFTRNKVGIPFADNPTLFIPITAGIDFFAL